MLQLLYLPHEDYCTARHLQQIITGKKKVFAQNAINGIDVPQWPELSVEKTWADAFMIPEFAFYIPDEWKPPRVDRDYFWKVLATLAPDYVSALIEDCRVQRDDNKRAREVPKNFVKPTEEWLDKLLLEDFVPTSKFATTGGLDLLRLLLTFLFSFLEGVKGISILVERKLGERAQAKPKKKAPKIPRRIDIQEYVKDLQKKGNIAANPAFGIVGREQEQIKQFNGGNPAPLSKEWMI